MADLMSKLGDAMKKRKAGASDKKAGGGTSTSSDVTSPTSTSTSTKAYTAGNFTSTVTGGAGDGATTVNIYPSAQGDEKKPKEAEEDDSGDEDQLTSIAKDMMSAIHSKDAGALKDLLQEAFEACSGGGE
jgi:hypothetical protein